MPLCVKNSLLDIFGRVAIVSLLEEIERTQRETSLDRGIDRDRCPFVNHYHIRECGIDVEDDYTDDVLRQLPYQE